MSLSELLRLKCQKGVVYPGKLEAILLCQTHTSIAQPEKCNQNLKLRDLWRIKLGGSCTFS